MGGGVGVGEVEEEGAEGDGLGGEIRVTGRSASGARIGEVVEDFGKGGGDGVEVGAGNEAGSPGGGAVEGLDTLADVGLGHPEGEGFGGGVVAGRDVVEGEGGAE